MNKSLKIVLIILMLVSQPVIVYGQNDIRQLTDSKAILNKDSGTLTLDNWNHVDVDISIDRKTPTSSSVTSDKTWLYYDSFVSQIYEVQGGIEWDIIITSPAQNKFDFKIDSTERMDWFYQPPLTEELTGIEYVGWTINETHAYNEKGQLVYERPIEVVKSYAVYGSQKNNQFKTGKIFHVYRPLVYDSKGLETWGDLTYNSGILSVSVDQSWLDKAVFPVVIDPTFGKTSVGGSNVGLGQDTIFLGVFPLNETAEVISISVYCQERLGDNITNGIGAIYNVSGSDPNGQPLIETTAPLLGIDGSWAWRVFIFNSSVLLSADDYAIGGNSGGTVGTNGITLKWDAFGVDILFLGDEVYPGFDDPFVKSADYGYEPSIYENYTVPAPPDPDPDPDPTPLGDLEAWDINWFISLLWIAIMAVALLKRDHILTIFAGLFGVILGLTLLTISPMISVALICLNLYLIYEGTD